MPRALLSVADKTGLEHFAAELAALGWDLVASGGTQRALQAAGLEVAPTERLTSFGDMLGGRVKTLHPALHAGILARDTDEDLAELTQAGYAPIDIVVCNLYPFQTVVAESETPFEDAIEHIDIGGVALLRGAAKNFGRVCVLVDPADYPRVLDDLLAQSAVSQDLRRELAIKAFAHTRDYDTAIHAYLTQAHGAQNKPFDLSDWFSLGLRQAQPLRYGENPHQAAGFYAHTTDSTPLGAEQLGGKELSYNNILDADAAWRAVASFDADDEAAVVIVKHLTPTGIAVGATPHEAFPPALASDPVSAFGGVIAVNRPVDADFVAALGSLFVEVLIAPDFTPEAREALQNSRKNCRVLRIAEPTFQNVDLRSVLGGVLIQQPDTSDPPGTQWEVVTQRTPTPEETDALAFAWHAVAHIKSNAIVLAQQGATVGIGGGLPSRVDAVKLAIQKAGKAASGAVLASDAFFPFPDGVEVAAEAGVTAVIQPGGSMRDQSVIDAANAAGLAMVFTRVRHFRH